MGYCKPYSAPFCSGTNEPMISATIPQCQMSYGKVMSAPIPVTKRVFKTPLLSSIIGTLIPADQFFLIPCESLQNMIIELTLNPYAMYTTGRMDKYEFDQEGIKQQIPRNWRITRIFYNAMIYDFTT